MVVAEMKGGLGNQLFQFSFAKSVSIDREDQLLLDTSWYYNKNSRQLRRRMRKEFQERILNRKWEDTYQSYRNLRIFDFRIDRDIEMRKSSEKFYSTFENFTSNKKGYDQEVYEQIQESESDNIFLHGYWQSDQYFEKNADIIRSDLQLRKQIKGYSLKNRKSLSPEVAIHFRRGDYVNSKGGADLYEELDMDYYGKAIEFIRQRISSPQFLLFSDDINWVKENIKIKGDVKYIKPKNESADLIRMSECDHFIIANSTYSWWGAWLSSNQDKIIIAPRHWYSNNIENKLSNNMIPESWIRI